MSPRIRVNLESLVWPCILALGLTLRLIGIDFGLADIQYHVDEPFIMLPVFQMFRENSLNPHWFGTPSNFIMYLFLFELHAAEMLTRIAHTLFTGLVPFSSLKPLVYLEPSYFYLAGRLQICFFAVSTLWLVKKISDCLFNNKWIGLLAALVLAIAPLHVTYSRFIRPDIPAVFWMLSSLLCLLYFMESDKRKWLVLSCAFAGFSISTKFPSGAILLPILFCTLRADWLGPKKGRTLTALATVAASFFVTAPFVFLSFGEFLRDIRIEARSEETGRESFSGIGNYFWYLRTALREGIGGIFFELIAFIGLAFSFKNGGLKKLVFLSIPVIIFVVIGLAKIRWERWAIPIFPFEAIYFAVGFAALSSFFLKLPFSRLSKGLAVVLFLALTFAVLVPVTSNVLFGLFIRKTENAVLARRWIEDHIPPGSKILYEGGEHYPYLTLKTQMRYVPFRWNELVSQPFPGFEKLGVDYVVVSHGHLDLYRREPDRYQPQLSRYEELKSAAKLIQKFSDPESPGFTTEIYEIPKPVAQKS